MRLREMIGGVMVLAVLCGGTMADELRHPPARKAVARAEQDVRRAEQVYRQELLRIHKALVAELERAKADAMQRQLLEDANAIQAAIDAARVELDRLEGKPTVQTFTIDAAKTWQPTVEVRKGQTVTIRARGTWTHYPAREPYDANGWPDQRNTDRRGAMFARVGDREFLVGQTARFAAPAVGVLELRMNDGDHSDNAGSLTVQIEVR